MANNDFSFFTCLDKMDIAKTPSEINFWKKKALTKLGKETIRDIKDLKTWLAKYVDLSENSTLDDTMKLINILCQELLDSTTPKIYPLTYPFPPDDN